jgi:hypothetical protein
MFSRIFPERFDNDFRGSRMAIWLFVPLIFIKFMMGFNSVFFTRFVATSADGLNLAAYGQQGAEAVLSLYALLGVAMALLALIGVAALVRYRTMIPFLYLVLLVQEIAGRGLSIWRPSEGSGPPSTHTASAFVLAAFGLTLAGFILSLWRPRAQSQLTAAGSR